MLRNSMKYMKAPLAFFIPSLIIASLLGYYVLSPEVSGSVANLSAARFSTFVGIATTNCAIIIIIYISVVFTKKIAYYMYILNGLSLGIFIGWILRFNKSLLFLIIPHGVFEIPLLLATGYIVFMGEEYIRKNFRKYILILCMHLLGMVICAFIEAYITTAFQVLI